MLIYVGATGEVTARFAGRQADGFICTSGKGIELYRDVLLPAVRAGAEASGRDFDAIEKMMEGKVSFDTDRQRALADTRIWAALALPAEDKVGVRNPREMEERAKMVTNPERRWLVSSDPAEHVEQITPYLELGFTHLVFHTLVTARPASCACGRSTSCPVSGSGGGDRRAGRRRSRPGGGLGPKGASSSRYTR